MIRNCIGGCGHTIEQCMGFGLARDVLAIQDGIRKEFPRKLCGVCVERASLDREWFCRLIELSVAGTIKTC
jgi:hypothetical protein